MPYKDIKMRRKFAREHMQTLRAERRYNTILYMFDKLKEVYGEETLKYLGPIQVSSLMKGLHFTCKDWDVIEELLKVQQKRSEEFVTPG